MGVHVRGRIVSAAHDIDDGVVSIDGERVARVRTTAEWRAAHPDWGPLPFLGILLPGLVDIHNHGGAGHRFDTVDPAEAAAAAAFHRGRGTTTVLAGIVTAAPDAMVDQVAALRDLAADGVIGGIHIEGPFLSGSRCGAHDPGLLLDPDVALTDRLLAAAEGQVRVMTIAPERAGFAEVARLLAERGVTVSLGHSDAVFTDFRNGLRPNGFGRSVTHLGNGMPPMHHRAAGPVAGALAAAASGDATVELIGDGVHIDSGFAAMVFAVA
ncbi:amidohydrolase family protein [Nocardia crassostreae]|uniref:amidohydrolase family protein n=1 Tax=Nocardia crassostreae TaxID=53428 RepID=UPI000B28E153|nr:amidohydrolase family protein [Nocardia crassostreae]